MINKIITLFLNQPSFLLITFLMSSFLFYFILKFFIKYNIIDNINQRSSHATIATRSGGISIFISIFIISIYCYINNFEIYDFSIIIPLCLLLIVGLYDDMYNIDFKLKFIFQIIAAKILIDSGLIIDNLHGILGIFELNRIIAQLITIFIIVAIINSINFIDGIDGLASSIILLFIIMFEFFALSTTPFINLSLILIASIMPMFFFNLKKKNKVFLGDSGSLFLGGIVSTYVIFILSQQYIIKPEFDLHKVLFVLSILIYPIIDITRITVKRIAQKKSPFEADKNHLHHILLKSTKSHLKTSLIIIVISLSFIIFIQTIF